MAFGTVKVDSITTSTKTVTVDNLTENGLTSSSIGSTVQAYDADTAKTDVAQTFTAAQRGTVSALTPGATVTPDFAVANNFSLTLDQATQIANPTNLTAGQAGAIAITNGSTAYAVSYGSAWKFEGGAPSFGSTTGAVSTLVYYVVSSSHIAAKLISEPAS